MTARTSSETINAMIEVRKLKRTPYDIALEFGISPSTLYRSKLFKAFKAECEKKGISMPVSTDPKSRRPIVAKKAPAAKKKSTPAAAN